VLLLLLLLSFSLQGKPIYDAGEPKVGPWISAFTRRREIFAGRIAMVGT
jgi:hypothetical protein